MESGITDRDRSTLLRAAMAKVERDGLKEALGRPSPELSRVPKAVANALNALRRHGDPAAVVDRPQYRAALPYLAALVSEACLARAIAVLGEHSDDPSRPQLLDAIDQLRDSYPDVTIGVMLASVAADDMAASDLCFDLAATDERFGLAGWAGYAVDPGSAPVDPRPKATLTPEQREARRSKKLRDADEHRKKQEAARRAGEQVRRARRQERASPASGPAGGTAGAEEPARRVSPRLTRRAALTPAQEVEFDGEDPWAGGVVFAWVAFGSPDPIRPDLDGKSRRCVVVAGSPSQLLVRPGYSEGGVKSRDWKSVPLRHWKRAGFDQPTWIAVESLRVPRDSTGPVGWLTEDDWNALW
jgi:hypothetical protein